MLQYNHTLVKTLQTLAQRGPLLPLKQSTKVHVTLSFQVNCDSLIMSANGGQIFPTPSQGLQEPLYEVSWKMEPILLSYEPKKNLVFDG